MNGQAGLVLKVILLSAVLSLLIKYGKEDFLISGTGSNALILVLLPTIIVASLLGIRFVMDK
jgi:hypothetical protein